MIKDLTKLQTKAQLIANQHNWKVRWNERELGTVADVSKGYRYLSIGDAIALCHSELSEALEEYRNEDKENFAIEIADEFIRLLHLCGDLNIDITSYINMKMSINEKRPINHGRKNL